tara:strand:- start:25149 stop:25577 length:429 start_codon:yes stop_codon:yes gene_type:complete
MRKSVKIISLVVFIVINICIYISLNLLDIEAIDINKALTFKNTESEVLVANFMTDEKQADEIYTGKVIEITGTVKEVSFLNNRNTLILQGKDKNSGVICDMNANQIDAVHKIFIGDKITVKGICKGYLKDVVMLNCIIITNN